MFNRLRWIFLIGPALLAGGCALLEVQQESEAVNSSTVLVGWVSAPADADGPIVVAAYKDPTDPVEPVHCAQLHEPGGYELMVPNGRYALVAFVDANQNLRLDGGEPVGTYLGGQKVEAEGTGVVGQLDMEVRADGNPPPVPLGTAFADCGILPGHSTQAGAVVSLDNPLFSREYADKAYWKPAEFFREVGGNVYFLEAYDATKIPVLFVHGAAGSPRDWRYLADHLDRRRYQPWFFYYPSGAGVDSMAHLLSWKLFTLRLRYRFETLYIAAHSMGGLVVRSLLLDHGQMMPDVKLFVSFSTPWGGEPTAELGVKYAPAVVPSWIDMQPQGAYMQSLFARELPGDIAYYLLFGFRGGSNLWRPNNDGTVTLASVLRSPAQAEAKQVYGFDEDHVGILSSPRVQSQFETILDSAGEGRGGPGRPPSGYVRVQAAYPELEHAPPATEFLWLQPVGRREAIVLPMSGQASRRSLGPIPQGDYQASLVVQSFEAVPGRIPLEIVPGETADLRFTLKPQGVLWGYVGAGDGTVELPAGSYVQPGTSITIDSITLSGRGIERKLAPGMWNDSERIERYLAHEDYAGEAQFFFFDLPAGEYRLTVRAEGYLPYTGLYTVIPGHPGAWKPVVLLPLRCAGDSAAAGCRDD